MFYSLTISTVRILSITTFYLSLAVSLSLSCFSDYHSPLQTTTCNNPIDWHHVNEALPRQHSFSHVNCTLGYTLYFWVLDPRPIGCVETLVRLYNYSLLNKQKSVALSYFEAETWNNAKTEAVETTDLKDSVHPKNRIFLLICLLIVIF